jgi:hypothetical protein
MNKLKACLFFSTILTIGTNSSAESMQTLLTVKTFFSKNLKFIVQKLKNKIQKKPFFCSICLSDTNIDIEKLSCSHKFHKECISTWKKEKTICPMCRKDIDIPTEENSILKNLQKNIILEAIITTIIVIIHESSYSYIKEFLQNTLMIDDDKILLKFTLILHNYLSKILVAGSFVVSMAINLFIREITDKPFKSFKEYIFIFKELLLMCVLNYFIENDFMNKAELLELE